MMLTLSSFLHSGGTRGLGQPEKEPFTPIVEITGKLTTIAPKIDQMLEDGGEENILNYLLPKMKNGSINLDNDINIGFCGEEQTYIG